MKKAEFPPKLFVLRTDLEFMQKHIPDSCCEVDVSVINSPQSVFITSTETYVHESLLREARADVWEEAASFLESYPYPIMANKKFIAKAAAEREVK